MAWQFLREAEDLRGHARGAEIYGDKEKRTSQGAGVLSGGSEGHTGRGSVPGGVRRAEESEASRRHT